VRWEGDGEQRKKDEPETATRVESARTTIEKRMVIVESEESAVKKRETTSEHLPFYRKPTAASGKEERTRRQRKDVPHWLWVERGLLPRTAGKSGRGRRRSRSRSEVKGSEGIEGNCIVSTMWKGYEDTGSRNTEHKLNRHL
jgi:hypothetical protein